MAMFPSLRIGPRLTAFRLHTVPRPPPFLAGHAPLFTCSRSDARRRARGLEESLGLTRHAPRPDAKQARALRVFEAQSEEPPSGGRPGPHSRGPQPEGDPDAPVSLDALSSVHLNPSQHQEAVQRPGRQDARAKSLSLCVLGVPNAGKSTLINALCRGTVCPYSPKTHTTRQPYRAILTESDTQLVFLDTPGVVKPKDALKFKLEESLVVGPELSCRHADLLVVVHDVSSRYTREALDKGVLRLLAQFHHIPSVLVLNKIDTLPESRRLFHLIRKLTCNHLDGTTKSSTRALPQLQHQHRSADSYIVAKVKRQQRLAAEDEDDESGSGREPFTVEAFLRRLRSKENRPRTDDELKSLLQGVVGWPLFRDVFPLSALQTDLGKRGQDGGVDTFREYLQRAARPADWAYSGALRTTADPREIVVNTVKAKLLEVINNEVPYSLCPEIDSWSFENDLLSLGLVITSTRPRVTQILLGRKAAVLSQTASLAEADLRSFFQCEVYIYIRVNVQHESKAGRIPARMDTPAATTNAPSWPPAPAQ